MSIWIHVKRKYIRANKQKFKMHLVISKTAVVPGLPVSEYARDIVALGEMELQTAELFEPKASFRLSRSEQHSVANLMMIPRRLGGDDEAYDSYVEEADDDANKGSA